MMGAAFIHSYVNPIHPFIKAAPACRFTKHSVCPEIRHGSDQRTSIKGSRIIPCDETAEFKADIRSASDVAIKKKEQGFDFIV